VCHAWKYSLTTNTRKDDQHLRCPTLTPASLCGKGVHHRTGARCKTTSEIVPPEYLQDKPRCSVDTGASIVLYTSAKPTVSWRETSSTLSPSKMK